MTYPLGPEMPPHIVQRQWTFVPGRGPVEMQAGAARSFAPGAGAAMAAKAAERRAAGPAASVQPKKPVESAVGPAVQPRRNSSPFGGRKKK